MKNSVETIYVHFDANEVPSCDALSARAFAQILKSVKSLEGVQVSLQASVNQTNTKIALLEAEQNLRLRKKL